MKRSRRQFLGTAAGTALVVAGRPAISFGQTTAIPPAGQPDVILTNGRIHTMDARNTVATVVSIRNGRIQTVGNRAPGRGPLHAGHRSARPDGDPRHHRRPRSQRQPGEPSRLPHHSREHDVDSGDPGSARRAAEGGAGRAVDHFDGRMAPEPVGRAPPSDAAGARRGGSGSAGPSLREIHRSVRDQQSGQGILRCRRCRSAGASERREGERRRQRRDRRGRVCRWRPVGQRAVSSAPAADVRGQEAEHARRDALLGQRRADRTSRPGVVSDAGPAPSEPDPVEPRPVPDVRPLAGAAPRGQDLHPAADELPAEPERPGAAGTEGTAPESVPVLRRRHADDRVDRRVGGAARQRRGLARGTAARRRGQVAERKQCRRPGGPHASRRGL